MKAKKKVLKKEKKATIEGAKLDFSICLGNSEEEGTTPILSAHL